MADSSPLQVQLTPVSMDASDAIAALAVLSERVKDGGVVEVVREYARPMRKVRCGWGTA